MELENLRLTRVVIHEVFQRADDRTAVAPAFGNALEVLDGDAFDALRSRVVSAMSSPSKCLEMSIAEVGPQSMFAEVLRLVDADDVLFVEQSKEAAKLLTSAQKSRRIPGGILIVFTGEALTPRRRIVGVIKAEVHNGFIRERNGQSMALKFLKDLLLTAQTKLYKIGLFVESAPDAVGEPENRWRSFIYDETISMADRDKAAQYFYEGFLGCKFMESSARNTRRFHDLTKNFIGQMDVTEIERVELHNALVTYLKVDQSPTVSTAGFAETYLRDGEVKDAYAEYMQKADFPTVAVVKDLSDVNAKLRVRKLVFRNDVKLFAPAEGFDNLVTIEVIEGDNDELGNRPRWTRLIVKADISGQE